MASTRSSTHAETIAESPNDQISEESMFKKLYIENELFFKCTECLCTSRRRFNVIRHYKRFHFFTKERKCCGTVFFTKAEYYRHSSDIHFNRRCYSIMFADDYRVDTRKRFTSKRKRRLRSFVRKTDSHGFFSTDQKGSDKEFADSPKERRSSTSVKTEALKFEDIPLINFLSNPNVAKYVPRGDTERANSDADTNMQIKTESAAVQNGNLAKAEENRAGAAASQAQSPILLHELPLKKRILQKTLISSEIARKTHAENTGANECHANRRPLTKINNTGNTARSAKPNFGITNKENNPDFGSQHVNIIIDTRISLKLLTQQQRIFLSPLDFNRI